MVRSRHGKDVSEIPVALDGVAVYIPASSQIQSLTLAQLRSIIQAHYQLARGWGQRPTDCRL